MHNCPEALEPFDGICGFSKHSPSYTNKTLFRFPLRSRDSKLSSAVYNIDKLHSLLDTLKDEAQYLLVFLRSVCSIEICKITESNDTLSLFKVSVSQRDYQARLSQQRRLVEQVEATFIGQSQYSVRKVIKDMSHFNIEKVDGSISSAHEWLVVNQVGSDSDEVMNLAGKQHILPWVGTAVDLKCSFSNGRIFCVLPLPVEDQAPFSVHINGTFAISSNRRSLKWEAQERKGDEEGTWNKLLVEKCLPSCYVKLVIELMELHSDPSAVYNCWPDIGSVSGTPWQGLLASFYQSLFSNSKVVHTPLFGGRWIGVKDAVFITADVLQAVRDAITKCNVNIVEVNDSCNQALKQYCSISLTTLQPALVRSYLKRNHQSYSYASRENKFEILKYCLKDNLYHDVVGLHLLPLANGSFQQFQSKSRYVEDTFVCSSYFPCNLLPGLENKLVNVYNEDDPVHSLLCSIANSSHTQLIMLNAPQVANLLSQCSTSSWSREQMSRFWQWLKNQQLSYFQNKQLVPIKSYLNNVSSIIPLARQGRAIYISQYSSLPSRDLLTGLEKCGIQFADAQEFSYLSHSQLPEYLYQFEHNQVLDALKSLSVANASLSSTEAIALQDFFSRSYLNSSRIATITMIPLFKVLQYDGSSRWSINSIRTSHVSGNKAIAMNGSYGFRTDLLPSSPFVIDASGNISSLLRNLTNFVVLMTETDYLLTIAFQKIYNRQFTSSSVVPFMISVLENFYSPQYRQVSQQLISTMRNLPFVEVMNDSATLNAPQNLFDIENAALIELYLGEWHRFPAPSFKPYLPILRLCGLKSAITADDIYRVIVSIRGGSYFQNSYNADDIRYTRIVHVMKHLKNNPDLFIISIEYRKTLLDTLCNQAAQYCWLPLASNPPSDYPSCLAWKGSQYSGTTLVSASISPLVVLMEDLSSSVLPLIVGSEAIFVQNVPNQLAQGLGSHPSIMVPAVISHFNQVVSKADRIPNKVLQKVSLQTYTYLLQNIGYCNAQLFSYKWIWLESLSRFVESSHVAVSANPSFRSNLEPFIFVLPSSLQGFSELFMRCSVPVTVTAGQILSVLQSIKDNSSGTQISDDVAWSIVRSIIEWIAENADRIGDHNILVPFDSEVSYPQLLPIEEVSYTDNEILCDIANDSDEEYHLIHPKVSHLASVLELTPLSDQLDITQDVFDDAGQHEPLTTRLSNILREYKDGLTIIKEMIQNADDAGATEVNILYDNRTHSTQKLLFKGMAESHGPALIVHNNSTFTDEDFENITKLAGATKANQPLKIGKFGVGFCSVYHITDVPSFVSGGWLYIFDPTLKYLKGVVRNESRPGKKVKYKSKFLARSQQLTPYEDLFGFTGSSDYNGTMFRLPFRTSASQISSTCYNGYLVQQMKDDLVMNGSKLLLFLQHVKRITFSSIQGGSPVTEVSINCNTENGIKTCVTESPESLTTEYWLVSSADGTLRTQDGCHKLVKASVACELVKEDSFYKCKAVDGSVFCFLPLSVPNTGLPVHISANFAVMSNRSGIWTGAASGKPSDSREHWNHQLMTTKIPEAYCSLLKRLQNMYASGDLVSYDFYALWPLTNRLKMKYPWESMILALYKLISVEKLFYSLSTRQWLTLAKSQFLPSLFQSNDPSFDKAAIILKLPVVSLPPSHMDQLKDTLHLKTLITEVEFTQSFLTNLESFENDICIRNDILYIMLSAIGADPTHYTSVTNQLQNVACIPTSFPCEGQELKLASSLVDPIEFQDMFNPEDGMFPFNYFYESPLVREAMIKQLGLKTTDISWDAIISSARTVKNLFDVDKTKALKRVSCIIKSIAETTNAIFPVETLKCIPFLPVLPKPQTYILPWKGDGCTVLPPSEVLAMANEVCKAGLVTGSVKAIVNTKYMDKGGCGFIPYHVKQLLGISTLPILDDVLIHFQHLVDLMSDDSSQKFLQNEDIRMHIEAICRNVYEFFENNLKNATPSILSNAEMTSQLTATEEKLKFYCDKPFIWTGRDFVTASNVAKNWKTEGPYLFTIPEILSMRRRLQKVLCINDNFDINKLLDTLGHMYQEFKDEPIPSDYHEFVDVLVLELNTAKGDCQGREQTILVDTDYVLRPSTEISYNDADWLQIKEDEYHFVHDRMTSKTVDLFGVKRIRSSFLDTFANKSAFEGTEFGQREELTQRIKNILRDYPLTESFLKELLQNADDAKASRMCVILDKRNHETTTTLSKEWSDDLQGPAILVWNDKDFDDKDLVGIQKLGLGSKQDDDESIGQFGIGFNVVYHVTDCPSFITRDSSVLCVFDPHCRYVPGADIIHPGRQFDNLNNGFWDKMSDLRSCYLQDPLPNQPEYLKTGTLFRYPLRWKKELVYKSDILEKKDLDLVHSAYKMEELLNKWVIRIEEALLFLNHITQFEYYVIQSRTAVCSSSKIGFELKTRYTVTMNETALQSRSDYQSHLSQQSRMQNSEKTCVPKVFLYNLTLRSEDARFISLAGDRKYSEKEWIIQQGIGDMLKPNQMWKFIGQVLPKHGLAVPLKPDKSFSGKIFCFLPLPISSKLPLHINGQFVLSSNRRALWRGGEDEYTDKMKWNDQLVEAISSSYVHFLTKFRHYIVQNVGYKDKTEFYKAVNAYYDLFPYWISPKLSATTSSVLPTAGQLTTSTRMSSSPLALSTPQSVTATVKAGRSLDDQWLNLAKQVFSKLWNVNAEVLVSEAYEGDIVSPVWHVLHNDEDPFFQAYFLPGPGSKEVLPILRRLGMTLTCASKVLHKHCKEFGSLIAKPEQTFEFYYKYHQRIVSYPEIVKSTPFKSEQGFSIFLKYIMKRPDGSLNFEFFKLPYNLPLLLTADTFIRIFNEDQKVLCSNHSKLFPNSSSAFLHPAMLALQMSPSYFLQEEEVTLSFVNGILNENLPFELSQSEVPDSVIERSHLQSLWTCISDDDEESFFQHRKSIIGCWAILPSTSHFLYQLTSSVIPIRCPPSNIDNELEVTELLRDSLSIPFLDQTIHKDIFKYCPQLSDYDRVFKVIYNRDYEKNVFEMAKLSESDIDILLAYFSRTSFRHNQSIVNQIKSFPIFKTVNGVFTSLMGKSVYLWPRHGFCMAGYEKWALLENVVFLEFWGSWRKLCGNEFTVLGEVPDEKKIYCKLIFPHFGELTEEERKQHLEYIKDNLFDGAFHQAESHYRYEVQELANNFIHDLKNLKCLPHNDTLLNISSFCDHTVDVFTTFHEHFYFLSDDYCDEKWLDFFRKLGLQVEIDFDTFVRLAEQVSRGDHSNIEKASDVLFCYIFSDNAEAWHDNRYKMSTIGDIRFVKAAKLKPFTWIKAPCSPPHWFQSQNIGLTKVNEAICYKHAKLIWTVKPVINLPACLSSSEIIEALDIFKKLGIAEPDPEDVYQNMINISKTNLSNPSLFSTYDHVLRPDSDIDIWDVIFSNIQYMENQTEILKKLHDVPCIPVMANEIDENKPVLVRPSQVLVSLTVKDFSPYLHAIPVKLWGVMESLKIMGVSTELEARHINYMLRLMNEFHRDLIDNPNDIIKIQKAIYKLSELLSLVKKSEVKSQLESLHLPTQVSEIEFKLVPAKQLVFKDSSKFELKNIIFSNSLYRLFKIPSYCDNLKKLKEKDFCLQLPREARPQGFSLCCHETILSNNTVNESPLITHFAKFRRLFPCISQNILCLIRQELPFYVSNEESTEFVRKLKEILTNMTVTGINDLRVKVMLDGDTECIGVMKVDYSFQKMDETYTLFVDSEASSGKTLWEAMAQTLCIEISCALELDLIKFFKCRGVLSDILAVQAIADMQQLMIVQEMEYEEKIEDDYVPKIGVTLPQLLVDKLSQDINHIFRPQELVGYEVALNHYIWAMILYSVSDDTGSEGTRLKRYVIAWSKSESEGPISVSSVYLHKFVTRDTVEESTETALVPSEGTSELQQMRDSRELKEIKRKIANELRIIWKSDLTDDERKKAVRRMFLKYHPDKAASNKHLYEEAFKYLLRQLDRLEKGLPLEEPDDEEDGSCEESHWHNYYNSCKDVIRSYRGGGGVGGGGGGWSGWSGWGAYFAPKPDDIEANRWLRQAKSDLEAMKILLCFLNDRPVSCQVAFLAHEVIEKALKSGMYALIGINSNSESLVHHKLTSHARAISAEKSGQLEELPRIALAMESSYLDTRFPNCHPRPNAPVDVYRPDQARINSEMAETVYELIEKIVTKQL